MKERIVALIFCSLALAGCESEVATPPPSPTPGATATPVAWTVVPRPARIEEMARERGEEDEARPVLRVIEPRDGSTVKSSTVRVRLALGGELKGYQLKKDPATGMGNHVHVILDNQPYEAYYNPDQPFELRDLEPGRHTLRVFPSRPWHESYKNDGAFQSVSFTVEAPAAPAPTPSPSPATEGKDLPGSQAGNVDLRKPLLTYSRPKGENKGPDAEAVMIDFWLANAKLKGDGGEYRVRYTIDGGEPRLIEKWEPTWLQGLGAGTHRIKLELVDEAGNVVDNGGYNSTTREFTVVR
jgi:hypothetical protein